MENFEIILRGQERIEQKLDKHIEKSNKDNIQILLAFSETSNRQDNQEKVLNDHQKMFKDIQALKYKVIGAGTLGGVLLAIGWELTKQLLK